MATGSVRTFEESKMDFYKNICRLAFVLVLASDENAKVMLYLLLNRKESDEVLKYIASFSEGNIWLVYCYICLLRIFF